MAAFTDVGTVDANTLNIAVAAKLPLAAAALQLLKFSLNDEFLAEVFQQNRGRAFERDLKFPVFVHVMSDAILGNHGSAHRAFQHAREQGILDTTVKAMYDRLATVPVKVSTGLFAAAAARLNEVNPTPIDDSLPASIIADFRPVPLDGKATKYVNGRLKILRGLKGKVSGNKLLVAQDLITGQAIAIEANVDGESSETPLVPGLVAQVRARPADLPNLFTADRNFCDFKVLQLFAKKNDGFLVRMHMKCKFHPDPSVKARTGKDDADRDYREDWGWLGNATNPDRVRVRRITVDRASGGPFILVTSLFDADRHSAFDLLALYRRRWGIETMFQQVVQTFDLRNLIGSTPEATIFQAVFCMLLYNITILIRGYVAEGADIKSSEVSTKMLQMDMVEEMTAWMKLIGPDATPEVLERTTFANAEAFRRHLRRTLKHVFTPRLKKSKTTKRPPKKPPRAMLKGGHCSVDRIRRGVHEEIPISPKTKPVPAKP